MTAQELAEILMSENKRIYLDRSARIDLAEKFFAIAQADARVEERRACIAAIEEQGAIAAIEEEGAKGDHDQDYYDGYDQAQDDAVAAIRARGKS